MKKQSRSTFAAAGCCAAALFLFTPSHGSDEVAELVRRGVQNYEKRNYATAYESFRKAMKINPNHQEAMKWFWKIKDEIESGAIKKEDQGDGKVSGENGREKGGDNAKIKKKRKDSDSVAIDARIDSINRKLAGILKVLKEHQAREGEGGADETSCVNPSPHDKKKTGTKRTSGETGMAEAARRYIMQNPGLLIVFALIAMAFFAAVIMMYWFSRLKRKAPLPPTSFAGTPKREFAETAPAVRGLGSLDEVAGLLRKLALREPEDQRSAMATLAGLSTSGNDYMRKEAQESLYRYALQEGEGAGKKGPPRDAGVNETVAPGNGQGTMEDDVKKEMRGMMYLLDRKFHRFENEKKVRILARETGLALGLDELNLRKIDMAALFKDIGFLLLPEGIIEGPGPLSPDQWEEVRRHPDHSAGIARSLSFHRDAVDFIRGHHERFDGSGYPDGKPGNAIPLGSSIIGLCDSFVALLGERPFRNALPIADALEILNEEARLFDPAVFSAFFSVVRKKYPFGTDPSSEAAMV